MQCPRCRQENTPRSKFCSECGARLVINCRGCGAALPPDARFCHQCGISAGEAGAEGRFESPDAYTPKYLAEKILTSRAALEGERKQVTVLFADMKGSMELLAERDAEGARKLLDPVLERMMEAVHRYEGTVNQVMGDGIMALFGAPLAHEDHAVRACYAALRMQEAVKVYTSEAQRSAGVAIQIRVGLNSGEVVVRSIRSDLRMDYTAVGQTTHLAARMEQMAMAGSILITAETLKLAEQFVEVRPLGPVTVKGLASAVEVYEMTDAGAARRRFDAAATRGLTRFVGRMPELEQLARSLERASKGQGQVVAVLGEPGVGKSRLFHEFMHSSRVSGWLMLESGSVSYGKATPYAPVIDLFKAYFQIESRDNARKVREKITGKLLALDRTLEQVLPAFLALLDVPVEDVQWQALDPQQRRTRMLDACKRVLLREGQVQPVLAVFEDLHWIDGETQTFLDSLVESLPGVRLLLFVNYRPEYRHQWGNKTYYTQLRIDPLAPGSAEELLNVLVGSDATLGPLKRLLVEKTEGNPLFLEECVRTLTETGVLAGSRGAYRLEKPVEAIQVPATVQVILTARIDRLPPEEKQLLQIAAVIGHQVPLRLLEALADQTENLPRALAHLQSSEFLYEARLFPEFEYSFKHALTHEVSYQSLLQERRRTMHANVLRAIEHTYPDRLAEHVEALAHHAVRGEEWEKALRYLRQAGAAALARGAIADSFLRYEQAIALAARTPSSAENLRHIVDARVALGALLHPLGEFSREVGLLREAEALAQKLGDARRLGRIANAMSVLCWFGGRYRDGLEQANRALEIATAQGDVSLGMFARRILSMHHGALGDVRISIEYLIETTDNDGVEMAKRTPDAMGGSFYVSGCSWRALMHAFLGEFGEATTYAERGIQFAEALGAPPARVCAWAHHGLVLQLNGSLESALALCKRALRESEKERLQFWASISAIFLGEVLGESGRAEEGIAYLRRGIALQEQMETRFALSFFRAMHARTLVATGQVAEARAEVERALALAKSTGERGFEAVALEVAGGIAAMENPTAATEAVSCYQQGMALAVELDMRPTLAHCHLGLGRVYRRIEGPREASEHLVSAARMYREMDMTYWLHRANAELKELA